ncbi:putative leader peptide [Streptomyces sp. NBC_00461]|uniref:putative leader peptide n=1 Tax=Streptomyces sp. NBC_00461 TaxID=2975750 RepID=UPI002E185423
MTVWLYPLKAIDRTEVRRVTRVLRLRVLNPRRCVRLTSRPYIDLQRVAGALCCS